MVTNMPAMRETQVQSLDWEDPVEKGMVTHSSILARRIPWTEEPGELQTMGLKSRTRLNNYTFTFFSILRNQVYLIFILINLVLNIGGLPK